jgi:hypothetical protein
VPNTAVLVYHSFGGMQNENVALIGALSHTLLLLFERKEAKEQAVFLVILCPKGIFVRALRDLEYFLSNHKN